MALKDRLEIEIAELPEHLGYYEFWARVHHQWQLFKSQSYEGTINLAPLYTIAANAVKLLNDVTNNVEYWDDEIISQATDIVQPPRVYIFIGLIDTLLADLMKDFVMYEEVDMNSLVKIGSACIAYILGCAPEKLEKGEADAGSEQDA